MKKIIAVFILLTSLFIVSCGTYPAVESTEEESRVLFTMTIGDEEYDVKYELYRALFLTHKSDVDGGDATVWEGDESATYIEKINDIIIPKIANIYATINLAEQIGVNFSSKEVKKTVDGFIKTSVEGGVYNGSNVVGYGSYDKYLEALSAMNLNYSVQVLMYHYAIAQTKIAEHYIGTLNEDNFTPDATPGKLEYTKDDVKEFYDSGDCVRILRVFIQDSIEAEERAARIQQKMLNASTTNDVSLIIIQNTFMSIDEAYGGMIIGRYGLDENNYKKFTETAFNLDVGEVSEYFQTVTGEENGYHILYSAEKSDEHFEEYYFYAVDAYLNHQIGKMIHDGSEALLEDIEYKSAYENLSHKDISMD